MNAMQGCECEFKKRAEIVQKNTKNGLKTQEKAHLGYLKIKKNLKSALKLNSHTPEHVIISGVASGRAGGAYCPTTRVLVQKKIGNSM